MTAFDKKISFCHKKVLVWIRIGSGFSNGLHPDSARCLLIKFSGRHYLCSTFSYLEKYQNTEMSFEWKRREQLVAVLWICIVLMPIWIRISMLMPIRIRIGIKTRPILMRIHDPRSGSASPGCWSRSGSKKIMRIWPDPDPQHWFVGPLPTLG